MSPGSRRELATGDATHLHFNPRNMRHNPRGFRTSGALAILILFGFDLNLIALIGIVLLIVT